MRDYSNLTAIQKVEAGNKWLLRNEVDEIEFALKQDGFAIDKKADKKSLLIMPEFEDIVRAIQIEYRLDSSPENN